MVLQEGIVLHEVEELPRCEAEVLRVNLLLMICSEHKCIILPPQPLLPPGIVTTLLPEVAPLPSRVILLPRLYLVVVRQVHTLNGLA